MQDETGDDEMIESVNVCAKLYSHVRQINKCSYDGFSYNGISYNGISYKEKKKAKSIKKCVKEHCMKFEDYVDAIRLNKTKRCVQTVIRSYQHNVFTEDVKKISISARDDKRIWLEGVYDMTHQYGSPILKRLLKQGNCVKN